MAPYFPKEAEKTEKNIKYNEYWIYRVTPNYFNLTCPCRINYSWQQLLITLEEEVWFLDLLAVLKKKMRRTLLQ